MELIPAIDLIEGQCVRLTEGDYATKKVYRADPVAQAQEFEQMGFTRLHVVDLDGAKSHHIVNARTLEGICARTHLSVDFGGGVKTDDDLRRAFDAGASLVTVGSVAVTHPELMIRWTEQYGTERLILGADVRQGRVSINGWKEDSDVRLTDFLRQYLDAGLRNVLCTEISRDGRLAGPATALYKEVMAAHPACHLIASGGVSAATDIDELQAAGIPAVVFGKAIYEGRIDLTELLRKYPQ